MSSNISSALKLLSGIVEETPKTVIKDGDGDDGGVISVTNVVISFASNGWIITTFYDNEEEIVEVFTITGEGKIGHKETVQAIIESMGVQELVEIK